MSAWHAVYRRDLLENHDILFESERAFLSEDILFHIDFFAKASRVAFIPDSLLLLLQRDVFNKIL